MGSLYRINRLILLVLTLIFTMMTSTHLLASEIYPTYPTPAINQGNASLVQKGEYLIKMGDCISCHTDTEHGGSAFAGGLAMKTPFGTFYTPNITPDKETGIGSWHEDDFIRALKEGRNPHGENYFPVFPYIYFMHVSDDDARAMFHYLMSIPAVHHVNKPLPFPFNVPGARTSLWGWKLLFFYAISPLTADHTQSAEWNRGKYIVDGLGHCSMCHTPLNPLGAPKTNYYLTGTFIDGYWAPNITANGLKTATVEDINYVFTHNELLHDAGPVAGPMAEVNHNSLMYLTDSDRLAIATYLKTVVSEDPLALAPSEAEPTLTRGREVYRKACVLCHQESQMTAPFIGNAHSWFERARNGGLETLYQHAINGYNSMPIKGACVTCSDNDIRAAVDYLLDKSLTRSQQLQLSPVRDSQHEVRDNE